MKNDNTYEGVTYSGGGRPQLDPDILYAPLMGWCIGSLIMILLGIIGAAIQISLSG